MSRFDVISPDLLDPTTNIDGLQELADFDTLLRNIGSAVVNRFLETYPKYPVAEVYGTPYINSPATIDPSARFVDFALQGENELFAHIVSATLPPANVFLLRGHHANAVVGVAQGGVHYAVEMQAFLERGRHDLVGIALPRRYSHYRVDAIPSNRFPEYLDKKRIKNRMRHPEHFRGFVLSQEEYLATIKSDEATPVQGTLDFTASS